MSNRRKFAFRFLLVPVICILAYFTVIFMAALPVAAFCGENYLDYEGTIYFVEGIIGVAAITLWILIRKNSSASIPPCSAGKPIEWTFGILSALTMLGIAVIYFYLASHMSVSFVKKALEDYDDMMEVRSVTRLDVYLNAIATCFMIPVIEEVLFRGIILEGMLEFKRPVLAIVFSSLYFGGMHGQIVQIGYALLAGMILGAVYYLTRNLLMSILAHIIFNIFGSGIYLLFNVSEKADNVLTIIQIASILPFTVLFIYIVWKKKKDARVKSGETRGEGITAGEESV